MEESSCRLGGCRAQGPSQLPTEAARSWISRIETRRAVAILRRTGLEPVLLKLPFSRVATESIMTGKSYELDCLLVPGKAQQAGRLSSPVDTKTRKSTRQEGGYLRVLVVRFFWLRLGLRRVHVSGSRIFQRRGQHFI